MQIFLIRHPRPSGIEGLCYGRLEVSVEQQVLTETAQSVFACIPRTLLATSPVYTSPSSRCLELAQVLADPRQSIPSEDLAEMNFGHWEGTAWDAIPRDQIDAWAADVWGYRPGGGESADMLESRWLRWLGQVRSLDSDTVVAVTHAGMIRVALANSAQPRSVSAIEAHVPFGSVHCLNLV
jgi:alpha-ribazole phosphatase